MRLPKWLRSVPAVAGSLRASSTNPDNPAEANQWRKLGRASSRNLTGFQHADMVRQCVKSAQVDPLARAHVRLLRSIIVGAEELGIEVRCKDETARARLQELMDLGWNHPVNDLRSTLGELVDGLTTTGSLALCLSTDDKGEGGTGSMLTAIGYIDPESFVDPGVLADPGNPRDPIAVLRAAWLASGPASVIAHPIVRNDDTVHPMFRGADGGPMKPGTMLTIPRRDTFGGPLQVAVDEPVAYLGINKVAPSQTLGISDLYACLDLMGLLDELVFSAVERSINIGAYSLQVKFPKGTGAKEIEDRMATIRADLESGKGRAVGTTDDVTIQAVFAALQSGEWATLEKMARTTALIGLGPWPVHIFSDGGQTNVATAAEQGSPVANFLLDRQNVFRKFMVKVAMYMLRRYPEARRLLEANPDANLHLALPVIIAKDSTRESNVLAVETSTLVLAVENGLIEREAAQREFRDVANRYGLHFKPEDSPDADDFEEKRAAGIDLPVTKIPATPPNENEGGTPPSDRGGSAD